MAFVQKKFKMGIKFAYIEHKKFEIDIWLLVDRQRESVFDSCIHPKETEHCKAGFWAESMIAQDF